MNDIQLEIVRLGRKLYDLGYKVGKAERAAAPEISDTQKKLDKAVAALDECASDLEAEVEDRYKQTKDHPAMKPRYDRDMEPVKQARAVIAEIREGERGE